MVWAGRKELSCQVLKHCGKCCNKKSVNVCVERDVATRMAQVIWPMMIVTATSFEGFTIGSNSDWQKCGFWVIFTQKLI